MTGRVAGRVAVITGAARGQGRAHALRLAEEGADLILLDISTPIESTSYSMASASDLEQTAEQVRQLGRRVVALEADVRDIEALSAAVARGVDELGRLDIAIVNHGIWSWGKATEVSATTWQSMLDVNLTGVWHTCKVVVPHVRAGGRGGSLVLISSTAGLKGIPNAAHYTAAKHGVVGLMRALANELAPEFIRVNTIHTTSVQTPMATNPDALRLFRPDLTNPTLDDVMSTLIAHNNIPVPWIEPVDVANAALFLASDESRYITGVTLPVDAGQLAKN